MYIYIYVYMVPAGERPNDSRSVGPNLNPPAGPQGGEVQGHHDHGGGGGGGVGCQTSTRYIYIYMYMCIYIYGCVLYIHWCVLVCVCLCFCFCFSELVLRLVEIKGRQKETCFYGVLATHIAGRSLLVGKNQPLVFPDFLGDWG